ncbi:hypothetical protein ACFQ77_31480, partial [Streptomyces virginiae]|uniref:hypothetical protein n=1 Tax=Streptomyces virginiae TaxID=1961 RepID=UPI0036B72C7F
QAVLDLLPERTTPMESEPSPRLTKGWLWPAEPEGAGSVGTGPARPGRRGRRARVGPGGGRG